MGRKIKGKKHHGVKDPEVQKKNREAKFKSKINQRPDKDDFQAIPKSLKYLMKVKEEVKSGTYNPNPNKKEKPHKNPDHKGLLDSTKFLSQEGPKQKGMNKPLKPIPVFKQNPGEHNRAFFYRMDQSIQSMKKRALFEDKYKVDVQMDKETGQSRVVEREKDEVDLEIEKKRDAKLAKKGIVRKSKEEKRVARREREKSRKNKGKKSDESLDFNDFQDNVEFGETVDAPPTLQFKKFMKNASSKPGAKEGKSELLLKKGVNGVKKAKLSMAQKVTVEKNRQHVVEMYRQIKSQKAA
eukprot:GFUD01045530.1.p1 GENE.GFUD01045530.1~~GFUD01045530.1.p1  ORF type:complete len:296 (-),score=105.52 GFUD01045530.1:5-892(-)